MKHRTYNIIYKNRQLIYLSLFLSVSAIFVSHMMKHADLLKEIRLKPLYVAAIFFVALLTRFIESIKIRYIMRASNVTLSIKESFNLAVVINYYNYIFTKAGLAAAGVYLKKRHKMNYSGYVGLMGGAIVIKLMIAAFLGSVTVFIFAAGKGNVVPVCTVYAMIFLAAVLLFFLPKNINSAGSIRSKISAVLDGWHNIRKDPKLLVVMCCFESGILMLIALKYYLIFNIVMSQVSFFACFILAPVNVVTHFLNIIPQGYGVKEIFLGFASDYLGYGLDTGVLVAVIDRVVMMSLALVLGPIFSYLLFGRFYLKRVEDTPIEERVK